MIRACINYLSKLVLLFVCPLTFAQTATTSPAFFQYLKSQKLYLEENVFIEDALKTTGASANKDTLFLHRASCLQLLKDTAAGSRALENITALPQWKNKQEQSLYLALLFMKNKHARIEKYLATLNQQEESVKIAGLFLALKTRQKIQVNREDSLLFSKNPVSHLLELHKNIPKKSALAAGLMSAVIPGSGKLYAGYKYQAFSAFIATTLFAGQAFEAYFKSGIKSPHFIYAGSIFSVYYFANIAGSAWAVKKKKRDSLREIDYEISDYYTSIFSTYEN